MKSTALTLTSEKYFERYAKFITEAQGSPQRITSPEDLDNYDVLVLSGGGDMGLKSGAYGDQTDNLPSNIYFCFIRISTIEVINTQN